MSEQKTVQAEPSEAQHAFKSAMWAFLFFFALPISFRSGAVQVDALPDLVGWLILVCALRTLGPVHPAAQKARKLAVVAGILSVFGFVTLNIPIECSGRVQPMPLVLPLLLVVAVIEVVFVWRLGGMVMDLASEADAGRIGKLADAARWVYAGSIAAGWIVLVGSCFAVTPFVIGIVAFGYRFIAVWLMMILMSRTSRMFASPSKKPEAPAEEHESPEHPADNE